MKKAVSIGLFVLLTCHMLAYVLVCVGAWWQDEHDLSKQLLMYRTVDSIVEFQIPLNGRMDVQAIPSTSSGFGYRGHYYEVVSLTVRGDTVYLAGLERGTRSFWQSDLLSFLNSHFGTPTESNHKTQQLLKLLLKEYSPGPCLVFRFLTASGREAVRIPDVLVSMATRALSVHSPPPEH